MRPGIGFPSYGRTVAWADGSGSSASYPAANAAGVDYPTQVARAAATGYYSLLGTLPALTAVQLIGLCQHNMQPGDSLRVRGYASAAPSPGSTPTVFDTGSIAAYPTGATRPKMADGSDIYGQTRPIRLSAPAAIASLFVEMNVAAAPAQVGAIELASWWEWPGVSLGRSLTVDSRETPTALAGGATHVTPGFAARQVQGTIDYVLLDSTDAYLDFQQAMDAAVPFLFVHDIDDAASWSRTTFLATNVEVPSLSGASYRADRFSFRFNEHLR